MIKRLKRILFGAPKVTVLTVAEIAAAAPVVNAPATKITTLPKPRKQPAAKQPTKKVAAKQPATQPTKKVAAKKVAAKTSTKSK
jgi:hypothetical protein